MKIALIHAPFHHRKFSENLKVVDEEFTLAPPIVLAYVAAIMERAGHRVILVDAHALRLSKEETLERVRAFAPDLLGFRLDTYGFQETLGWIKSLKAATGLPVLAGGINLSLYPGETMSHAAIDFALEGEAVETLPMFLERFGRPERYREVPGLLWREDGELRRNPPPERLVPFDDYPEPARHLLPNGVYHSFVSQRRNFTVMLTSTGCPYRCRFCAIAGLKHWRQRGAAGVIAEIERCYHEHGVREIDFFDATFFVDKKWSLEFCSGLARLGLDLVWTARSRVDLADGEVLAAAAKAGCRMIFWGIESSSQNVLDEVNKDITPAQVSRAIEMARGRGIRNLGFLMVGNPGDTEESIEATVDFAKTLGLDYVQICRAIPKPGTEFHRDVAAKTGRDYWSEFVALKKGEERIPVSWTEMPQEKVEKLLKKAYLSFYFRPGFIWRTLRKTRSFEELGRYAATAIKMLFNYLHTDVSEAAVPPPPADRVRKACVIIPAYNEKENVVSLVREISGMYPGVNILVMDSSRDGTREELARLAGELPNVEAHYIGKTGPANERGSAVKEGFRLALERGAEVVVEMDADLSHDPAAIGELIRNSDEFDLVIGSRYINSGALVGRSLFRNLIGNLANLYVRYSLGLKAVHDCTSGYRCFRRDALEKIGVEYLRSIEGTEALIEMLYRGFKGGLRIKEVPITYLERRRGASKFSFATVSRSLRRVWVLRWGGV
ncbi:MAG TPA: radical SAM protein [Elusimicrobiales bacterium]|nr:radical SAM protein [Elusimicrobiales bacterium]